MKFKDLVWTTTEKGDKASWTSGDYLITFTRPATATATTISASVTKNGNEVLSIQGTPENMEYVIDAIENLVDMSRELMSQHIRDGVYKNNEVLFALQALEVAGIAGHPKANQAYYLAYEYGHASGFQDTLEYLCDLAELVLE